MRPLRESDAADRPDFFAQEQAGFPLTGVSHLVAQFGGAGDRPTALKTLAILMLFLVAGCASGRRDASMTLAGEWLYKNPVQSCRYDFKKDGTFSGEVTQRGEAVSRFMGKWTVQGTRFAL